MLGNFRLSLGIFPFLAPTSISRTCLSFGRRQSLLLILFLALFLFALSRISLVTFLMSFFSVLSALYVCIFLGFLPSLLVLTLFFSPRSPSRSLSKNALSFFLRDVISRAYSSPSASSSSSSSSSSAFHAHSIRGVAAFWAFSCNASLSSVLAAATWSSSSVFPSFYLRDVLFSSHGFGLGPVAAAGNVV